MLTQLKFTHLKSKKSGAIVEQYVKLGEMRSLDWKDDSFGFCQDSHLPGLIWILKFILQFILQYELKRYLTSSTVSKKKK